MADPVKKPLKWSKAYPAYAEKHDMYRVFQELLKELIIFKPLDPLAYIRDELPKIAEQLYSPRVFIIGPNVSTQGIGRHMAQNTGARYLTLADVVETAPMTIRGVLAAYVQGDIQEEGSDDGLRKLLVATIQERVRCADCTKNGYILYGFPQNKAQALCAQQSGLLPRQVYILLPDPEVTVSPKKPSIFGISSGGPSKTPTTNTVSNPTPNSQMTTSGNTVSGVTGVSGKTVPSSLAESIMGSAAPAKAGSDPAPKGAQAPSQVTPPGHQSGNSTVIVEENGTVTKISSRVTLPENDFAKIKEISDCYDYEICKTIPYEKWFPTKKTDVEAELLANLVSIRPCGSPWIPRVLVLGPPSSGKSTMAEELSTKYGFINVDFIECIRGAALLPDDVGKACKKYLHDLNPMSDSVIKTLIQRRLFREDCERKGWILHGFPDTNRQLTILDILEISPNRVFYLSCPEEVCWSRAQQKRQEVLERKLEGAKDKVLQSIDEMNFEEFPYGKVCFRMRTDNFNENIDAIAAHFGKDMVYVDASKRMSTVYQFMDAAVLRPPVIRFQEPE